MLIISYIKKIYHTFYFTGRQQSSKIQADSVHAGALYKDDEIWKHFDPSSKRYNDINKNCLILLIKL